MMMMIASGCGSTGHGDAVAVRIGQKILTTATVRHWMAAVAPKHVIPRDSSKVKRQALKSLIAWEWLVGEAREEGVGVSGRDVQSELKRKERSYASRTQYEESLRAIDYTVSDAEREIEAELASKELMRMLMARLPRVTSREIGSYYQAHRGKFKVPEFRTFYIVENIPSLPRARRYIAEFAAGKKRISETSLNETFPRKPYSDYRGEKRTIYEAIFKARPHVVTPPIRLNNLYFLVEVTRVTRPFTRTLREARDSIGRKLATERRTRALERFIGAWRRRWLARTVCAPGYVVQKCRQYKGSMAPEDPLSFE